MEQDKKVAKRARWKVKGESDVYSDPLLDCIVLLAKIHGQPISKNVVRSGLPLVNNLLTVKLFPRAARRAGFSSRVLRQPLDAINPYTLPAILLLKEGKACVIVGIDTEEETVTVIFPETGMGEEKLPREEIEKVYKGYAIFARPE